MMAHGCNPRTQKAEAVGLQVLDQLLAAKQYLISMKNKEAIFIELVSNTER